MSKRKFPPRTQSKRLWPAQISTEYYEYCLKQMPPGAIKADLSQHAPHNSYGPPMWYVGKKCKCVRCGCVFFFSAREQQYWYERVKVPIHARAIRCANCRRILRDGKAAQKKHMDEMAKKPVHPNKLLLKKVRSSRSAKS